MMVVTIFCCSLSSAAFQDTVAPLSSVGALLPREKVVASYGQLLLQFFDCWSATFFSSLNFFSKQCQSVVGSDHVA